MNLPRTPLASTAAVILAGGRATRMGGGDKCRIVVEGRPVIERIRAALGAMPTALNANGDPARFADLGMPVLVDPLPDQPGPLAGVLAGLEWAGSIGCEWVLTVPGDTPFLPVDLAARLHEARGDGSYACAGSSGVRHPIVALWPVGCRDALRQALAEGRRKVGAFAPQAVAIWPGEPIDPFTNINSPGDVPS